MPPADPLARIRERLQHVIGRQHHFLAGECSGCGIRDPGGPSVPKCHHLQLAEDLLVAVEALQKIHTRATLSSDLVIMSFASKALDRIAAGSEEGS